MLNDYLSKLPRDTLGKVKVTQESITLPMVIDSVALKKAVSDEIEQPNPSIEKSLYVASTTPQSTFIGFREILNNKLRF